MRHFPSLTHILISLIYFKDEIAFLFAHFCNLFCAFFKFVIFHPSLLVKFPELLLLSEPPEPLVHVPRPGHHREFGRHLLLEAIGAPPDRRHVGEALGPLFHLLDVVLLHESDGEAAPARRRPRPLAPRAVRVVVEEPLPALLPLVTAAGNGAKDGCCGVETVLPAIRRRQGCQVLQVCVGNPKETEVGELAALILVDYSTSARGIMHLGRPEGLLWHQRAIDR